MNVILKGAYKSVSGVVVGWGGVGEGGGGREMRNVPETQSRTGGNSVLP
jgi:hypothetical protein